MEDQMLMQKASQVKLKENMMLEAKKKKNQKEGSRFGVGKA